METASPLGRRDPEIPVLPSRSAGIIAPASFPNLPPVDGASVDVVGPEESREIELGGRLATFAATELEPVTVAHAHLRLAVEQTNRRREVARGKAVIGVE